MSVTFKQLSSELIKWKDEYGEKAISKKWGIPYDKIDIKKRRNLFLILVERLKDLGAEREFFDMDRVQREISKSINPPKNEIPIKSFKGRVRGTTEDLEWAVTKIYGTESGKQRNAKKLTLAETIKKEDLEEGAEVWTQAVTKTVKKPVVKREFDASRYKKTPLEGEPVMRDELDPEMAELLGFKK